MRLNAKCWFSEKISKIDQRLSRLTKKKRKRAQINKIGKEKLQQTPQKYKGLGLPWWSRVKNLPCNAGTRVPPVVG